MGANFLNINKIYILLATNLVYVHSEFESKTLRNKDTQNLKLKMHGLTLRT